MSTSQIEEAVDDYKNADTSNTILSLQEICPAAHGYSSMTRTTYIEFNPANARAEVPSLFARDFGQFLHSYVMLQDPNQNKIQIFVEKNGENVYFTRGWPRLRYFYGLYYGGWVIVKYVSPILLHIEVTKLTGIEVSYPRNDPPRKLMLLDQSIEYSSRGPVPYFVFPKTFTYMVEKKLTQSDVESGMLRLAWDGFCEEALPHQDAELTFIDWMGFTWKCHMHLQSNNCRINGEWKNLCEARKLTEGSIVKIVAIKPSNNTYLYLKVFPFLGVRTTLVAPTIDGGFKAFYQVDNYYML